MSSPTPLPWGRLLSVAMLIAVVRGSADTFTVTTTAATGTGSLAQAILDANANPGADFIAFDIGTTAKTITSAVALPEITEAVTLDGTTQPGFAGSPLIELNGSSAPAGTTGLVLTAPGSTIRGLVINRWKGHGIEVRGGSNNVVEGCWIGVSLLGTSDQGNTFSGIFVNGSPGNRIGGTTTAQRNVVSGNEDHGILIRGGASDGNRVEGNFIGLNATGANVLRNSDHGIAIEEAPNSVIGGETAGAGNVVSGNNLHGIWIGTAPAGLGDSTSPENTRILGNLIGLDPTGTVDLGNVQDGIHLLAATDTRIGGTTPAARNVISGNNNDGIEQAGGPLSVTGTVIEGNFIGLDASGTIARGNSRHGIAVTGGAGPRIGGTTPGAGNIISGNTQQGIHLVRVDTEPATRIEGNRIGTDPDGTLDLGNSQDGIRVEFAGGVRIGGSAPGAGNLISGNNGNGIQLTGSQSPGWATGVVIEGNRIGTDADGSTGIPNNAAGVFINAQFNAPASGRIGGTDAGQGNLIAFNNLDGVFITGVTAGNTVRGNSIHSNGQLGIDLAGNGVTNNDGTDADTGSNGIQNFPILNEAVLRNTTTEIHGTIQTLANAAFTLDFYGNDAADTSGNGEGQTWLGSADVTTDATGFAAFTANVDATAQRFVSATATDADGNTSEFSAARRAVTTSAPADFTVTTTADSGPGSLRQAILDANAALNEGDRIVFAIPGDGPHTLAPTAALPALAAPVALDATTQAGAAANTLADGFNAVLPVILDGASAPSGTDGLRIEADRVTIRGLRIINWKSDGIEILASATRATIEGNVIGLGPEGEDRGQNNHGILVSGAVDVRIGGPTPAQRNVLSGNNTHGIFLNAARENFVEGNFIGTDPTGTLRVGNSQDGIHVTSGTGNRIGGSTPGTGNVIGGNNSDGVDLENTSGNTVEGNRIGIALGGAEIRNGNHGVFVNNGTGNRIGGTAAGAGNVIALNSGRGVVVNNNSSSGNSIRGNAIFANGNLGIDLANNGRTLNDTGDTDTGPNGFQNFPEIATALAGPDDTRITGTFQGAAEATFTLEFFSSPEADSTGFGEGQQFLGSTGVTTDANGDASFDVTLPTRAIGRFITATATAADGSTSEFSAAVRADSTIPPATFTVTTAADSGPGSLRQALLDADRVLTGPPHRIVFDIPGDGPHVIQPATALPVLLNEPVGIDGFTQPGASANTSTGADNAIHRIVLDGSSAPFGTRGLRFGIPGNVVRGLVIVDFRDAGIELGSDENVVEGCRIGIDVDGTARPNASRGIHLSGTASGNRIGGPTPGARNVIAGNSGTNLEISSSTGDNEVLGNFIGTLPDGSTVPATHPDFFGTSTGILIANSPGNRIGGAAAGAGNLVGGHQSSGIEIRGTTSTANSVLGNRIGTDHTGLLPVPNGSEGIQVGGSGNRIGGPAPGEGNLIAFNTRNGVSIFGFPEPDGNAVRGNSIRDNGALGINLAFDGVLENDPGDADAGSNRGQNFPILTDAIASGTSITIEGSLQSEPDRTYTIDFFANGLCDASGNGEGAQFLGSTQVTTGADGTAVIDVTLPAVISGRFLTATATDPDGNTSEFGDCLEASTSFAAETFRVTNADDSGPGSLRAALLANNTSLAGEPNRIEFDIPGAGPHILRPAAPLPTVAHAVVIDGFSQPGARANAVAGGHDAVTFIAIEAAPGGGSLGLVVTAPDCTVRGISFTGWFVGVDIDTDRATIAGCLVGLKPDGSSGQNSIGIRILGGTGHRIGGTAPADRNLIGGNSTGLQVDGGGQTRVEGNHFGLRPDGSPAPNFAGINVTGDAHRIGGAEPGAGNVIASASNASGLRLGTTTDCVIEGNRIGTNPAGTEARPNGLGGIDVSSAATGTVVRNNLISGNSGPGISTASDTRIVANQIGVAADGVSPLGNNLGIQITGNDAVVGGPTEAEANLIAHNRGDGIVVRSLDATRNTLRGNRLHSNSGLGINLGFDGQTANDPGDADSGPNGFQNFPVLTAASIGTSTVDVSGTLDSTPSTLFQVDVYANLPDPDFQAAEGRQHLGSLEVTTDASGAGTFSGTLNAVAIGRLLTATATGPEGTSEFSASIRAGSTRPGGTFAVTTTADEGPGSLRQALLDADGQLAGTPHLIRFEIPGDGPHVLSPASRLPVPIEPVAIDGFTQAGAAPGTSTDSDNAVRRIRIDGAGLGFNGPLLRLDTPGSSVRGLVVTGAEAAGIELGGSGGVTVAGCLISGNAEGIVILGSHDNRIGGTTPADRNVIVAQPFGSGVLLLGEDPTGNRILGNFIGVDTDGVTPAPNRDGIRVETGTGLQVGGTAPGEGNRIVSNSNAGVRVAGGQGTTVRGNRIADNGRLGIDLGGLRVTANDPGDADTGANGLQNFPVVTAATLVPAGTRITGTLDSIPGRTYAIDFHHAATCDPLGHGQGALPIGSTTVTTDASGSASFDLTLPVQVPAGVVTALATDPDGNTSEFGACREVVSELPPATFVVTTPADEGPGSLRQAILDANTAFTAGANTIAFNIPGTGRQILRPGKPLPTLTRPVTLDGFTQPGAAPAADGKPLGHVLQVRIDGNLAGAEADGLHVTAPGSRVRGLIVTGFGGAGIHLDKAHGSRVDGNWLGTDGTKEGATPGRGAALASSGNVLDALANKFGIRVTEVNGVQVGSVPDSPAGGNLVSGNLESGVFIADSTGVTLNDNLIGTDPNAPPADTLRGNGNAGIWVESSDLDIFRDTISGNGGPGIALHGGGLFTDPNPVLITDSTITGNGGSANGGGILFENLSRGPDTPPRSVNRCTITDNGGPGVTIFQSGGVTVTGSTITGNTESGCLLDIADDCRIGESPADPNPNDRNLIKGNGGGGLLIRDGFASPVFLNDFGINNLLVNHSPFAPGVPTVSHPNANTVVIHGTVPVFTPSPPGDAFLQIFVPAPDDPGCVEPGARIPATPDASGAVQWIFPATEFTGGVFVAVVDIKGDGSTVILAAPETDPIDVDVDKTAPMLPVGLNEEVSFRIQATANAARPGGYKVVLRDPVPPGLEYRGFTTTWDSSLASGGTPTVLFVPALPGDPSSIAFVEIHGFVGFDTQANLGAGGTRIEDLDVTLLFRPARAGTFVNSVQLARAEGFTEVNPANNEATATAFVVDDLPPTNFAVTVNGLPPEPVEPDTPFEFTVIINNTGPNAATPQVEINLPPGLPIFGTPHTDCLSERPAGGAATGPTILRCDLDELLAGASRTLTFSLVAEHPGRFPFTVSVTSTHPDPDPDDNRLELEVAASGPMDFGDAPMVQTALSDFGALPAGYPTTLAANGARHVANPAIRLGGRIDTEADGQPDSTALLDDVTPAGADDEDGVEFDVPHVVVFLVGRIPRLPREPGVPVEVEVDVRSPEHLRPVLSAWIDFNADGDWDDAGERIFDRRPVVTGLQRFGFNIPATGAAAGFSYARFRLSSRADTAPTGLAPDGEVEDYLVLFGRTDFGDATLLHGPAAHLLPDNPVAFLGAKVDADPAYQDSLDARGDDTDADGDDEDGVRGIGPLFAGLVSTVEVIASRPGFVELWIDYNASNAFDALPAAPDPTEYVNASIIGHPGGPYPVVAGANVIRFRVPDILTSHLSFLRVRYTTVKPVTLFPDPVALMPDGEVEDYRVQLYDLMPDFGDAPDSLENPRYPTLLAHDGAFHLIVEDRFHLGARIDVEPDAIPSDDALGDDGDLGLSFPPGNDPDDEDGIRFLAPLVPGTSVPLEIVTTLDSLEPALVQAWVDFNRDFDWSDPGEQVLLNHPVLDGTNTVSIAIPATALPGATFARFRLTRTENLGFTGVATGGEVEDHRVEITAGGTPLRIGTIRLDGAVVELSWDGDSVLESAPTLNGPWTPVPGGASPLRITSGESDALFFRLAPR